ncbi:hypothetical protein BDR05DRAFT_793912 [Suillus weaverae]|nr:hypothetical protein BDR05DRAFT_793912 [Suillus weaverae]
MQIALLFGILAHYVVLATVHPTAGVIVKRFVSIITSGKHCSQTYYYGIITQLQTFHNRNEVGSNLAVSGLQGESHHTSFPLQLLTCCQTGRNARKLTLSNSFTIRVLDLTEELGTAWRARR